MLQALQPNVGFSWANQINFNRKIFEKIETIENTIVYVANKRTLITFTGETALNTVIDCTAAGATWTKAGDDPDLGVDANTFNDSFLIQVLSNGRQTGKPDEIEWVSSTSLKIKRIYDNGETLFILS